MPKRVDIPGVGVVEFPDSMSADDVAEQAQRLHSQAQQSGQIEAGTGRQAGTQAAPPPSEPDAAMAPFTAALGAINAFSNLVSPIPGLTGTPSPEVVGATVGSAAFPPAGAVARGLPLLTRLGRLLPGLFGAGAGGAAGGAAEEAVQGGSAEDIAGAGLAAGGRMAGAEAVGRGLVGAGARVLAPAVGLLDDTGRLALNFARGQTVPGTGGALTGRELPPALSPEQVAPGSVQRGIRGLADFLIPSRAISQPKRRAVVDKVLALPTNRQNELITRLVHADTREVSLTSASRVAERTAGALGKRKAAELGFQRAGPRDFISRVFQDGDPAALKKRLGDEGFHDLLTANLEAMLTRSTMRSPDGKRVIDGEKLQAAWESVPDNIKSLYPQATREAMEGFSAFALASQRVPELAAQGVINLPSFAGTTAGAAAIGIADTSTIGLMGAGVAALTARALMSPTSLTNRYLTREKLGPEVARIAGREIAKLFPRNLLAEPPEQDEVSVSGGGGLLGS